MLQRNSVNKDLVATCMSAQEILLRRHGKEHYNHEKTLARINADSTLIIDDRVAREFGVTIEHKNSGYSGISYERGLEIFESLLDFVSEHVSACDMKEAANTLGLSYTEALDLELLEDNDTKKGYFVAVSDIVWDTDGEDVSSLPKNTVIFIEDDRVLNPAEDNDAICDMAVDALSNQYGFCVSTCVVDPHVRTYWDVKCDVFDFLTKEGWCYEDDDQLVVSLCKKFDLSEDMAKDFLGKYDSL